MAINNEEKIDSLASQILGPRPDPNAGTMQPAEGTPAGAESQQPPAEMAGNATPSEAAASDTKSEAKPTVEEKVQETASPKTEGDKTAVEGVIYEVEFAEGDKRKLNNNQIKSTFERYGKLNAEHAAVKPAMELVKNLMKEKGMDATGIKDFLENATKAFESNPQMGNVDGEKQSKPQTEDKMAVASNITPKEVEEMFTKYEEENSISLPPAYREQMAETANLKAQIADQNKMIQQLVEASKGMATASAQQVEQADAAGGKQIQQQIAMNLNSAQQQLNLPDDAANDFMTYASERGYTMEDFVDPDLTMKVVQDFNNERNTPEMARLRDIASRRSAVTGSLGSSPNAGMASEAAPDPNAEILGRLSQRRVM